MCIHIQECMYICDRPDGRAASRAGGWRAAGGRRAAGVDLQVQVNVPSVQTLYELSPSTAILDLFFILNPQPLILIWWLPRRL